RIEKKYRAFLIGIGFVRMAIDDRGKTCRLRVEVEFIQYVEHIDIETGPGDDRIQGKAYGKFPMVDIATNGMDGGDSFQLGKYFGIANVAPVNNKLGALQGP